MLYGLVVANMKMEGDTTPNPKEHVHVQEGTSCGRSRTMEEYISYQQLSPRDSVFAMFSHLLGMKQVMTRHLGQIV